jgi:hypothetical protein
LKRNLIDGFYLKTKNMQGMKKDDSRDGFFLQHLQPEQLLHHLCDNFPNNILLLKLKQGLDP